MIDWFQNSLLSCHVCDDMCWVKWLDFSCGWTVLQYCCWFVILTAWNKFMKISHRKGSTRVKNDGDVTVIIFATFKMYYKYFHSTKTTTFCLFNSNTLIFQRLTKSYIDCTNWMQAWPASPPSQHGPVGPLQLQEKLSKRIDYKYFNII